MATQSDVLDVVEVWSGQRPTKVSQVLEDWWNQTAPGSSHSTLPFDPDGIQDLVGRIDRAFPNAEAIDTGDLGSSGGIKSVQDLVNAVNEPAPAKALVAKGLAIKKAPAKKAPAKAGSLNRGLKTAVSGKKTAAKKAPATKKTKKSAAKKAVKKSSGSGKKTRR